MRNAAPVIVAPGRARWVVLAILLLCFVWFIRRARRARRLIRYERQWRGSVSANRCTETCAGMLLFCMYGVSFAVTSAFTMCPAGKV